MHFRGPKLVMACAASVAISGCGEVDIYEAQSLNWTELEDGSFFTELKEPEVAHMAERCWPNEGRYTCITVSQIFGDEIDTRSVAIANRDELRDEGNFSSGSPDGYGCEETSNGVRRQAIVAGGEEVDSNIFGGRFHRSYPWQKESIERRLARSGVEDPGYFDCFAVVRGTGGNGGIYPDPGRLADLEDFSKDRVFFD